MPLSSSGDLVGVLSLAAWRPAAFAPNTAAALAPLTELAAMLLRQVSTRQQTQERLAALEKNASEGLAECLHELKSPLHAAAGFVELVADELAGPLNEQQQDFLNTARSEFMRVKDNLAALVELGAAAAERPLDLEVVTADAIARETVERFHGQAGTNNVTLTEDIDSASAVLADRAAIQQVLANFVQNALRVVPKGSEIVIGATSEPDWTYFSVADRGPGLPGEAPELLFEPFNQGDSRSGRRRAGNVGLGLAVSKKIVEQHQGRIWAENRDGGGSRFSFALPTVNAQS